MQAFAEMAAAGRVPSSSDKEISHDHPATYSRRLVVRQTGFTMGGVRRHIAGTTLHARGASRGEITPLVTKLRNMLQPQLGDDMKEH
jgi:hypothetical protein